MNEEAKLIIDYIMKDRIDIGEFLDKRIDNLSKVSQEENDYETFFGVNVPLNSTSHFNEEKINYEEIFCWIGFIPKNVKIIYGYNMETIENEGMYYYLDDNTYLKDFIKYLKGNEIHDDYEFLGVVKGFLDSYFTNISKTNDEGRETFLKPLLDKNNRYIEPSMRSNKVFYHNNIAMCSEYASMGLNILSIFGYHANINEGDVSYGGVTSPHAFNFAIMGDKFYLVDFAFDVNVHDIDNSTVKVAPFIKEISDEKFDSFYENYENLYLNNYHIVRFNNKDFFVNEDELRLYTASDKTIRGGYENEQQKTKII